MSNLHLVTGYANKEHIKSADQGSFNAAMLGEGQFVLERGNKFASTIISNTTVRIADGDILMQGRHIRLNEDTYVDLEFENGQQGYKRNDLIVVRYTKDSASDIEEANLLVIKGGLYADEAVDPEYNSGDIINDHVLINDMPLYRVPFDGLNIQELEPLFEVLPSWKTLKAQSVEETEKAVQKAGEAVINEIKQSGEEAVNDFKDEAEKTLAAVPAVLQGTSDPTASTVGILGQSYINTKTNRIFYCTAVSAGSYTWAVSTFLPEIIVKAKSGATITITDGQVSFTKTSTEGTAVFALPNYGTWEVTGTADSETLTKKVEVSEVKQYTVKLAFIVTMTAVIDLANTNPDTCVSYADDAVDMTPGSEDWNDFFGHYPVLFKNGAEVGKLNPNDITQFANGTAADITSGNAGDVMIAYPRRGLKIYTSNNKIFISMTNAQNDPDFKYYAHQRDNTNKNVFYLGRFKGWVDGSGKLRSLSGKQPTVEKEMATFRTHAHNNGSGYEQSAFYQLIFRQCMFFLKFRCLNSQTAVGRGLVDADDPVLTGGANAYGMDCEVIKETHPEYMTDGQHQVCCLGLEDFWGNIYEWIEGLATDSSYNILTNTTNFQDNGKGSGYKTISSGLTKYAGGWMKTPQGTTEAGFIIKESGGSGTTCFCDYAYFVSGYVGIFGSDWCNDDDAGVCQLNICYDADDCSDDVGARLMYL